jgi:putative oligomerization/nucleic acid binding protein
MFRRRRPLLRAAAVGGAAYYAGKKVQEGRDQDAVEDAYAEEPQPAPGISEDAVKRLEDLAALKEKGVLTQAEFDAEKQKILNP